MGICYVKSASELLFISYSLMFLMCLCHPKDICILYMCEAQGMHTPFLCAGVFSKSLGPYLEYVRNSGSYSSKYIESTLEYRDDVKDGLEVSTYSP